MVCGTRSGLKHMFRPCVAGEKGTAKAPARNSQTPTSRAIETVHAEKAQIASEQKFAIMISPRYTQLLLVSPTCPDLVRIAEEVEATKKPRELRRDNKTVAVIMPAKLSSSLKKQTWENIAATFGSWNDVDADVMIANIYRWREEGSRPAT